MIEFGARAVRWTRGSAMSAICLMLAACGGASGNSPTGSGGDSVSVTPTPSPSIATPAPAAAAPPASVPAGALDLITTRSGHWRLTALPAQGDAAVYRMTLDESPKFIREFACRPIFTKEAGKSTALDLRTVRLLDTNATVAQGACRVVQNMDPVAPRVAWIREAVAGAVIPAYQRERAWLGGLDVLARDPARGAYDPMSLGPRPDGAGAPTSGNNFVGVTSAQGGEYPSSRGFLHDADARVVDAALHNEDAAIAAYWPEFVQYSFYSLAQPQGAAWSATNHVTVDPQFPQSGDRSYETAFYNNPNGATDSMTEVDGWARNTAHLEDTGFVHWLATEDPIAGLVVQRQAAFALAERHEYQRGGHGGTSLPAATAYAGQSDEERALFNTLSALWKSRDVSRRVSSLSGSMLWSADRTRRQADDVISSYDAIASRIDTATAANPADYVARLSGALFGSVVGIGSFDRADGSTVRLQQTSAFQAVQYGKEPLWLWTKAGNPAVRRWFTTYAGGLALRMAVIGGAMGADGRTSQSGSGYPTGPTVGTGASAVPAVPDFSTPRGWAEWVAALPLKQSDSRASFDGASLHTAIQIEGALLMARDAGLAVSELDAALARIRTARAATTAIRYPGIQMHKHLGAPLQ